MRCPTGSSQTEISESLSIERDDTLVATLIASHKASDCPQHEQNGKLFMYRNPRETMRRYATRLKFND